jgi:hypothetical protein
MQLESWTVVYWNKDGDEVSFIWDSQHKAEQDYIGLRDNAAFIQRAKLIKPDGTVSAQFDRRKS